MKIAVQRCETARSPLWLRTVTLLLAITVCSIGYGEEATNERIQSLFETEGELYTLVPNSVFPVTGIQITVANIHHSKSGWQIVTLRSEKETEGLFLLSAADQVEARFPVRFERVKDHWEYSFEAKERVDAVIVIAGSTYFFEATGPSQDLAENHPEPELLYAPSIVVPPDFLTTLTSPFKGSVSLESGLIMNGIELPPGAAVLRGSATGEFLMRNTKINHEKLSKFISEFRSKTSPEN